MDIRRFDPTPGTKKNTLKKIKNMPNINDNAKTSATQTQLIAQWLQEGNTITQIEALSRFGCFRLASRINDLRRLGLNIATEKIITATGKRVARYRLIAV